MIGAGWSLRWWRPNILISLVNPNIGRQPASDSLIGMSDVHVLSRAAYERLKAEHDDLTTRGRIEIAQAIEKARELGDLSENGDYHAAKDQQGWMEARIRELEKILKHVEVVDEISAGGAVTPGTVVTILYEGDDESDAERYLVGHIEERHDDLDVISPGS